MRTLSATGYRRRLRKPNWQRHPPPSPVPWRKCTTTVPRSQQLVLVSLHVTEKAQKLGSLCYSPVRGHHAPTTATSSGGQYLIGPVRRQRSPGRRWIGRCSPLLLLPMRSSKAAVWIMVDRARHQSFIHCLAQARRTSISYLHWLVAIVLGLH